MYCVCAEHLDQAIDEFVEVYEMPPDIYRLNQVSFTAWEAPATCNFCSRPPQYLVV
ncbi:MAG TPA: CxxH/CxxC protein [Firmicutes bacterium]|nr:CxxH/CxxC protein [Bacillota bacterium]